MAKSELDSVLSKKRRRKVFHKCRISCNRLYRVDLERQVSTPPWGAEAHAPGSLTRGKRPAWKREAVLRDLQERTISEIVDEIFDFLRSQNGKWRVRFFYWKGAMKKPEPIRHMGKGEHFLYDDNPRGDTIAEFHQTFDLDLGSESN